ncbi:MAG: tetratricopeptide repeat protein [Nitrospinae bacterium]|nr:tetratricopeptide repeat protein [Nitrospinota bacterium]
MDPLTIEHLRVLVADDAANMRRTVRNMLRALGVPHVVEADNGETAWEALNARDVNFVICDWHMPRLPGMELLRRVRDNAGLRDIPFLMITAEVSESRIAQAAETEVDGYLLKPFMAKTLEEKIRLILRKKERPSQFDIHMRNGRLLAERKIFDESLTEYRKALELKPDSARARHAIGEVCLMMGNTSKAEQWLLEAARANPQYVRAHESLGEFYQNQGRDDRAVAFLERAAEISPHSADRQLRLGKLYLKGGDPRKADLAFQAALESDALNANLRTEIGEIYLASGEENKAAAAFKSSLSIVESVHVYNRLGIALRRKKRYDEAIKEYQKALKVAPNDEAIYYNMGRAWLEMGDYAKAEESLARALELDADFTECRELLGRIRSRDRSARNIAE